MLLQYWKQEVWMRPSSILGELVRHYRNRRGWTLADLVRRLTRFGDPWTISTLSRLETGKRAATVEEWLQLAAVLGVPPLDLLADDPNRLVLLAGGDGQDEPLGREYDAGTLRPWLEGAGGGLLEPEDPLHPGPPDLHSELRGDPVWLHLRLLSAAVAQHEAAVRVLDAARRSALDELEEAAQAAADRAAERVESAREAWRDALVVAVKASGLPIPHEEGE
jgi:transcriptional regulator with XRE-family HTH domain